MLNISTFYVDPAPNSGEFATGNPAEEMPLGNTRLYRRFKAVEDFDGAVHETVISLIDTMIATRQMQTPLVSLDDQATASR
jgi:hypothetical protein